MYTVFYDLSHRSFRMCNTLLPWIYFCFKETCRYDYFEFLLSNIEYFSGEFVLVVNKNREIRILNLSMSISFLKVLLHVYLKVRYLVPLVVIKICSIVLHFYIELGSLHDFYFFVVSTFIYDHQPSCY